MSMHVRLTEWSLHDMKGESVLNRFLSIIADSIIQHYECTCCQLLLNINMLSFRAARLSHGMLFGRGIRRPSFYDKKQ